MDQAPSLWHLARAMGEWSKDEQTGVCVSRDLLILLEKQEMNVCQATILLCPSHSLKENVRFSPFIRQGDLIWGSQNLYLNIYTQIPILKTKKQGSEL